MTGLITGALALTAMTAAAHAACNAPGVGNPNGIRATVTRQLYLGTFTRPDATAAAGTVNLSAAGVRTLPPTLTIARDAATPATMPYAAVIEVTGRAGCLFNIVLTTASGDLLNPRVEPAAGYTLSSTSSGAQGTLDAVGRFRFTLGISQSVTQSNSVGGSITIVVNYI